MTLIIFNRKNATEDWLTVEMDKGRTRIHACNRRDSTDRRKKKEKGKKKKGKKSGQFWKNEFSSACFRAVLPAIRTACFFTPCRKVELIELTRLLRRVCAFGTANIFLINAVCSVYYIECRNIITYYRNSETLIASFLRQKKRKYIYTFTKSRSNLQLIDWWNLIKIGWRYELYLRSYVNLY